MLTAYIDESIEPNGNFVLGGYISDSSRWREFSIEWERLLRRFGTLHPKEPYYHFKYQEMMQNEEREERILVFEKTIKRHAIAAISCRFHLQDLEAAKKRIWIPDVELDYGPYDDPYKLAYRCLMDKFHNHRAAFSEVIGPNEPVNFVFDDQLGSKTGILEGWDEYLTNRSQDVRSIYGSKPLFRDDRHCLPLQAADFWAGKVRSAYSEGGISRLFNSKPNRDAPFPCIHIEWSEDDLVGDFIKLLRGLTDRVIYDVRYGDAWDALVR